MEHLTPQATRGRNAFFRPVHEIPAEQGSDGVTVSAPCERLGAARGSFHHHFETMSVFVAATAEQWEQAFGAPIDGYVLEANPLRRLEPMMQTSFALPDPTVTAWWAWGQANVVVSAALRRPG